MQSAPLPSLLAPPQSIHADAHCALDAHGTSDVMPLPALLAPPPAVLGAPSFPPAHSPLPDALYAHAATD
eukprot:2102992-Rhodomonas_salina.1